MATPAEPRSRLRPGYARASAEGGPQSSLAQPASRVSPPSSARYARRAIRQLTRNGSARDLMAASEISRALEERGQADTVTSAESRVAEDTLRRQADEQLAREREAALDTGTAEEPGDTTTGTTPSTPAAATTAAAPIVLGADGEPRFRSLAEIARYSPPEPESARQPGNFDARLEAYRRQYLPGEGSTTDLLRASAARRRAEIAARQGSPAAVPPPEPPASIPPESTIAATPEVAVVAGETATLRATEDTSPEFEAGRAARREIFRAAGRTVPPLSRALAPGVAAAEAVSIPPRAARGAARVLRAAGQTIDAPRRVAADVSGVAVSTGARALLDRIRRAREFGRGLTNP